MLFSDFAASGGVLGVALVDAVHPLIGPDLPQPAQTKPPSTNIMIPDLPQPTQPQLGTSQLAGVVNFGSPDPPQPTQPRLGTSQLDGVVNFIAPAPPQPTPPTKLTTPPFVIMPSAMGPDLPQPPPNK